VAGIQRRRARIPRTPFLNSRFSAAVQEFGIALKKTSSIQHRGDKGRSREASLRAFFRERLPTNYAVAEGEVVDLIGQTSPQLDIMFYDRSANFALVSGTTEILPAEALLSSIEVKSMLNKAEIEKSVLAARKLRVLQPFGRCLGGTDIGHDGSKMKVARYFHCIFAFDTDLSEDGWMFREAERFKALCGVDHLIDGVYVLNRGFLNVAGNVGMLENSDGTAVTNFYFSILNFIQRESGRRKETPYYRYVTHPYNVLTASNPAFRFAPCALQVTFACCAATCPSCDR
jgi:hypothetical protein